MRARIATAMSGIGQLLGLVAVAYAALCVFMYLVQDRLIFYPSGVWREPRGEHVEPVTLTSNGVELSGWVVKPDAPGPVLVYFGGNAEELSGLVDVFARLDGTTLLVNYRGYGRSEGSPTASALLEDARAVVALARRYGPDRPLVLFGRSLGSGIAASVAQVAPVDAVILMSPYRSLSHLARRLMPWLPTRWLLRHRIDVLAALEALPEQVLVLYSPEDRIVPAAETRALLRRFAPPPRVVEFRGGHNVSLTQPLIWREVAAFLAATRGTRRRESR